MVVHVGGAQARHTRARRRERYMAAPACYNLVAWREKMHMRTRITPPLKCPQQGRAAGARGRRRTEAERTQTRAQRPCNSLDDRGG